MQDEKRLLTPQQELFLSEYINPKSKNFGNAVQSALAAGYSEYYANNITSLMPEWLYENMGDMKRLKKAERNLSEVQDLQIINEEGKPDASLIEKRSKVDMFLLEKLHREKYGNKTDVTSGGKPIFQIVNYGSENNNNPVPILSEGIPTSISEESSEIQDSGSSQESREIKDSTQSTDTENPT